jgi:hypothetical protein
LHERIFSHLQLPHLQLDELRTRLRSSLLLCADSSFWAVARSETTRAEDESVAGGSGLDLWPGEKSYRRRKLVRVRHVMRLGAQADLTVVLQHLGFSGRLNTACIERVNLTVRHGVAALARRTWATSHQAPQLLAHLEWW